MKADYVIVGAGLTGLNLGRKLKSLDPNLKISILEKSKSCGGRMATRRINDSKYDHGAQFIKNKDISQELIQFWQQENILQKFPTQTFSAFCGIGGMTQLAKKIAENLEISFNRKVTSISKNQVGWQIIDEVGEIVTTKQIVLTCPLPQSLDLLKASKIDFDFHLSNIHYAKALVYLVEFETALDPKMNYQENFDQDIFSICSQGEKGISSKSHYTVTMSENWSEEHFSKSDENLLKISQDLLSAKLNSRKILNSQIKKWKYSHPQKIWEKLYYSPEFGIYLAGDAFGGPSLTGALKSSNELFEHLKSTYNPKENFQ